MSESDYWQRFSRRRIGRRALLRGAAVTGAGLAAGAVIGCGGGGSNNNGSPGPSVRQVDDSHGAIPIADARQKYQPAPAGMHGGTLRYANADSIILDRFDPHQTQLGPMFSLQSAIFSRLYMYQSQEEPTWENIVPDLAEGAPEMVGDPPDTYVIKLRKGVKFHDNEHVRKDFPSLAGRELTADDVLYSINRQRNPDSPQRAFYYRSSQYATVDTIEKVDDYTIRIVTKGPVAPFFHFLADTNAMIIPREIVDQAKDTVDVTTGPTPEQRMIGTGPFMWDNLIWGTSFKAVRNPNWFGWGDPSLGRPNIDGYEVSGSFDDATSEPLFRKKGRDAAGWLDNPDWIFNLKDENPELVLQRVQLTPWVNSRLKANCPPFDDVRVRKAMHLAVDRQEVIDALWKGEARMVGPVGIGIKYWALPEEELAALPGYRRTTAERQADIKDARAAYEAAGSPELPPVWNADIPPYIPSFMSTYAATMKQNLGVDLVTRTHGYPQIFEGYLRNCDQAQMSWVFDNGWIDLDDWVYPYFHSKGPKNSFGVKDPELDTMLEAQRREFNVDRRRDLGYQIQRHLLGVNGDKPSCYARIDYAAFITSGLSWPYLKNRVTFPMVFGTTQWNANVWLDRNDPSYAGRPD